MKIIDESCLQSFRDKLFCELCEKVRKVEPHHVFGRGFGGGNRLDIPINIVALCRKCHQAFHTGHICRSTILRLVAKREGMTVDEIETEIYRLRRITPRGRKPDG